jgi:hypothetical protein
VNRRDSRRDRRGGKKAEETGRQTG